MALFIPRNPHTHAVTLAPDVLDRAARLAWRIEHENRRRRRRDMQGLTAASRESLAMRVSGYCGEAAVAMLLGFNFAALGDDWRESPDVGGYNVRTTPRLDGRLIVTPRDSRRLPYVLVIDQSPVFHVCGWLRGEEAQRVGTWEEHRRGGGAWYVPQALLRPLDLTQPLGDASAPAPPASPDGPREPRVPPPDPADTLHPGEQQALDALPAHAKAAIDAGDWRALLRAVKADPDAPPDASSDPTDPPDLSADRTT